MTPGECKIARNAILRRHGIILLGYTVLSPGDDLEFTIRKDKLGSPYADIYRNKCDESESCKLYLWLQMKKLKRKM